MPSVTICIVNYNSKEKTDTCLSSIFENYKNQDLSVFVVDNNSQDKSKEYLEDKWREKENVVFMCNTENKGFGQACNQGFETSQSEYFIVLNPDIQIQKNTIEKLIAWMEIHKNAGITGPQLIYPDGAIQDSYRHFPTLFHLMVKRTFLKNIKWFRTTFLKKYLLWEKDPRKTEAVDWLVGAFLCIRREAVKTDHLFDPRYFLFFEDVDVCRSMWDNKFQVMYIADSQALHAKDRLSAGGIKNILTNKMLRIHIKSALQYFWKWRGKKLPNLH